MGNKKIFIFDIDGTILNDQRQLMPGTVAAVDQLHQQGHFVILSSGRIPSETSVYYRQLNLRSYIVGAGGSTVFHIPTNTYINARPIALAVVEEFIEYARKWKREISLNDGRKNLRFYFGNSPITDIEDPDYFVGGTANPTYDDFSCWAKMRKDFKVIQVSLKAEKTIIKEWNEIFIEKYKGVVTINESTQVYLDITPYGVSKASGLTLVFKKLNLSPDDAFVFGDSTNDVSSMLLCKTAIAMGNARTNVKEIASVVIGDNNHESIYKYLKAKGFVY